jgi:diguanylate cyclase (GGDEF)-like protein
MGLISRHDASLATSLIVGLFVLFNRPLAGFFEFASSLDQTYGIALMPALTVLAGSLAFHHYRKWYEYAAEVRFIRTRVNEVERLLRLAKALAEASEREQVRQALLTGLPSFCGRRTCWVLEWKEDRFHAFLGDANAVPAVTQTSVEEWRERTLAEATVASTGLSKGEQLWFLLTVGQDSVGLFGIDDKPELSEADRSEFPAVAALLALALRNLQTLETIRSQGIRDALTGCVVRAHGLERLNAELRRSYRSGRRVSVLVLDIDEFKTINDTRGHLYGDLALEAVGRTIEQVVRLSDVRCRIGGDEFLVILPDTDVEGCSRVAEKLRDRVASLHVQDAGLPSLSVSIGCATSVLGDLDSSALVHRADQALYRAKREGRNRVRRFEPEASPSLSQQRIEGATSAADDTHSDRSEHSKDASLVPR